LTATADRTTGAVEKLNRAENWIRERVGDFIYANRDIGLEAVLAEELIRSGKTVAVVESCTGGLLASRLTDIPGSSNYFMQGVVAYSNKAKHEVVGVPQELLEKHGAVSRAVAEALAEGIRGKAKTTFGLAVTGIAGPGGATAQKPVGLVYIACAEEGATVVEEHRFADDRLGNKMRTEQASLNLLRKSLFNLHIK
jgi:nicotinamide-nucleotide amidase